VAPGLGLLVEIGHLGAAPSLYLGAALFLAQVRVPEAYPLSGGCGVQRGVEPPVPFNVVGVQSRCVA
jgi:hypothetical protein